MHCILAKCDTTDSLFLIVWEEDMRWANCLLLASILLPARDVESCCKLLRVVTLVHTCLNVPLTCASKADSQAGDTSVMLDRRWKEHGRKDFLSCSPQSHPLPLWLQELPPTLSAHHHQPFSVLDLCLPFCQQRLLLLLVLLPLEDSSLFSSFLFYKMSRKDGWDCPVHPLISCKSIFCP